MSIVDRGSFLYFLLFLFVLGVFFKKHHHNYRLCYQGYMKKDPVDPVVTVSVEATGSVHLNPHGNHHKVQDVTVVVMEVSCPRFPSHSD